MKAALIIPHAENGGRIELRDVDHPQPKAGEVLIQTRHPKAAVIAALASGERDAFYAAETEARREAARRRAAAEAANEAAELEAMREAVAVVLQAVGVLVFPDIVAQAGQLDQACEIGRAHV